MSTQSQSLQRFQDYVSKTKDADYGLGSVDEDGDYPARLSKSLQSLQNQVKQHEAALERVCPCSASLSDVRLALLNMHTATCNGPCSSR